VEIDRLAALFRGWLACRPEVAPGDPGDALIEAQAQQIALRLPMCLGAHLRA
jgi:hypothetical protein